MGRVKDIPHSWAAEFAKLKSDLDALAVLANDLRTKHNGMMAKLDADAGVTDTNYAALGNVTAPAVTIGTK